MNTAQRIVAKFGGRAEMAKKTGFPVTTIQTWEERGIIGAKRQRDVLDKARELNVDLKPEDFFEASDPPEGSQLQPTG